MRERKLPLRTILQNFINHVDTLEVKRTGGDDIYEQQFQELKLLTESLKGKPDYCCFEGERDVNRRKNRYKDILPYDYTRVVLSSYPGVPGSDYINANYIRGASGSKAYIASQGPLPHTTHDFWRMVVDCDVQVIIMASNETEGGKHKCECYWVNTLNDEKEFGNVTVSYVKARQVCPDFMVRTLKIKYTTESGKKERTICQFHYVLWPDHGVPDTVRPLLEMVQMVRDCQASETLPVLVHCSAGCGRTGTICAIDYVWGLLRSGRLTENLNLFGLVKDMRRQRVAMVQTREQYILLHQAVRELFKDRLKVIDAHPYENIATDGTPLIQREKESDYEELYVKPEKQDESAKQTPPTTAPSVVSTPTGSLTRSPQIQGTNNKILPSISPTSTLDGSIPPLPLKLSKPPPPSSVYPSPGVFPHSSPVPKPSPVHNHASPVPQPSPVSHPSPNQAQYGSIGSFHTSVHHPSSVYAHSSPTLQGLPNQNAVASSSTKLGNYPASKFEKEVENAAHKKQVTHPTVYSPVEGIPQLTLMTPASGSPQPVPSNSITPSSTPNNTPTPIYGLTGNPTLAPTPPTRSRTPSPSMTYRKSYENQVDTSGFMSDTCLGSEDEVTRSSEIVRRPSIAKLKELFEKAGDAETPGVRLSRSASSVTSRSGLSVHQDSEGNSRVKRKSSLGAEETLQSKKAYEIIEKSRQLNVCPPPPNELLKSSTPPVTLVSAAKPPSSPVYTSPVTRRRGNLTFSDSQEDGSTSALLARVDDRPALPVKKSKSFRYPRSIESTTNTIASTRSPELMRKKVDINTYFSLDRVKGESVSLSKSEISNVNFISDIPSPRDGFKLSVYQMPDAARTSQSSSSNSKEKSDEKPQIPPKKVIGERFRNARPPESLYISAPQPYVSSSANTTAPHTPPSAPPVLSSVYDNPAFWSRSQNIQSNKSIYDCPKDLQNAAGSDYDNLPSSSSSSSSSSNVHSNSDSRGSVSSPAANVTNSITLETSKDVTSKEYVNARVVRNHSRDSKDPTKYVYLPLPSKRGIRDNKAPHEYANCSLMNTQQRHLENTEGEEPSDLYMDPHALRKSSLGKFPLYDEVGPSETKENSSVSKLPSKENVSGSVSTATTPLSATTPGSADYEVMDFGESTASVDEVFETVNYELINSKDRKSHKSADSKLCFEILKDICSKKDLDPVARQVYQDCQDYLLHGNNKSPVPSLMPKPVDKDSKILLKSSELGKLDISGHDTSMDVDEVKSKVNVAPQGLRTRERRNSYRQAVNPLIQSDDKAGDDKSRSKTERTKSIHKYETIWFENGKHSTRRNNPSPNTDQHLHHQITKSPSFAADGSDTYSRGNSIFHVQMPTSSDDHSLNLNNRNSSKDALFKEKLEELNTLVNSLERQKPSRSFVTSPGIAEEDSYSRGSGSNNSTLQSRSTTSSKSSEPQEPIYANAPPLVPNSKGQQQPASRSTKNPEMAEAKSPPPPLRYSRTEPKPDNSDGNQGSHSPLVNGNSLYGTIATSTFRSKQHGNNNSSSPAFQTQLEQSSTKPPSPFHTFASTATLPARASTAASSSPYHSIPPPKGFGSGTSPNNSPNPLQAIQKNRESRESAGSSPYYNMAAFTSGIPGQKQHSNSGQEGLHPGRPTKSPYSNLPSNAAVFRSSSAHHQHPKAHIVGDIAIVGEESVRLRRPGVTPPSRTDVGSGYSSSTEGAPVAPPRIKRNSSAGLPRHSAIEPPPSHMHNDWRCTKDNPENYRQTILTAKQSWPLSDDDPPPALPAKTPAAYQYPDTPATHNYIPPQALPTHHTPYLQPPPPKPVISKASPSVPHHSPSQNPIASSSVVSSTYQSPPGHSQNSHPDEIQNRTQAVSNSVSNQRPLQSVTRSNSESPLLNPENNHDGDEDPIVVESSTDTSDDEGIFHKFPKPSLFKKWRTNNSKQIVPQIPSSPKSAFYAPAPKEVKDEKDNKSKDQHKEAGILSSTSPKPLVKAFGKLKMNSKSVAANFKSYLSQRGDKADGEVGNAGSSTNGLSNNLSPSSPNAGSRNIQKSASSGSNINVFSQVVQDYKYPTPIPKKPAGPRDMPANMRGSTPTNTQVKIKTGRPRQQYL